MLVSTAALLGACGVGLGAAGVHAGGGDLARLGSLFLLIHAAAIVGLVATALPTGRSWPKLTAATILGLGAAAFGSDLATRAFTGAPLMPGLAPFGGTALIGGWIGAGIAPWVQGNR